MSSDSNLGTAAKLIKQLFSEVEGDKQEMGRRKCQDMYIMKNCARCWWHTLLNLTFHTDQVS